ncbi:AsmA family protein [soil metagenome]
MTSVLKILGIVVAAFVGLFLLAALLVPLLFDPNDYKDEIAAAVEERTGRKLDIDGDLTLEVFPWLAVGVGRAALANAPGFGDEPFAQIESASLSLRLLPLLKREIEIGTVRLDGLVLNLAVDETGRSNWEGLTDAEEAPAPEREDGRGIESFTVGSVEITDARVSYTDVSTGAAYLLEDFQFETAALKPGEPFDLTMRFQVHSEEPELHAAVDLAAEATTAPGAGRLVLAGPTVDLRLSGGAVPGDDPLAVELAADSIVFAAGAGTLTVDALVARLANAELRASAIARGLGEDPQVSARIAIPEFAPRELLEALDVPLETADPAALRSTRLSARLAYGAAGLVLEDVEAMIDETRIDGSLRAPSDEAAPIRFAFAVDAVDLDRYLPPAGETESTEQPAAPIDDMEIPVETLRGLRLDGSLRIGELIVSGMRLQNVELGLQSDGRQVRLHPIQAAFYGGAYQGDIRLDVEATPPSLSLDEHVQAIQLGPLTRDMYEIERITGRFDGDLVLSGTGDSLGAMRRTLRGKLHLVLADGAIEGIDIWGSIRAARALLPGQPAAPKPSDATRTEITELRASATVDAGVVRNDDLVAQLPFLYVTGQGRIDLPESAVDYRLLATVAEKPELTAQSDAGNLTGKTIPVAVTGTFADLKVRPDIGGALVRARDRIETEIRERLGGGRDAEAETDSDPERNPEDDLKEKALQKLQDLLGD